MGPKIKSLVDRVMMRSKICPKICVDTVTCCFQQLVESYSIIAMHQIHVKVKIPSNNKRYDKNSSKNTDMEELVGQ